MHREEIDLDWVRSQYRYETLTWPELDASVALGKVAVIPVGSIEQHGHHLPVDVDVLLATSVCLAAGERAPETMLVLPPVTYGYCHHVMDFPGTITVRQSVFTEHLIDIGMSLAYHGFKKIVYVNGHGSNHQLVERAARAVNLQTASLCASFSWWNLADEIWEKELRRSEPGGCGHACELETAMYLHVNGDGVRKDRVRGAPATSLTDIDGAMEWQMIELTGRNGPAAIVGWTSSFTPDGTCGRPDLATAAQGEAVFNHTSQKLVDFVAWYRNRPIPGRVDHHLTPPTFEFPQAF